VEQVFAIAQRAAERAGAQLDHRRRGDLDRPVGGAARQQQGEALAVPHELAGVALGGATLGACAALRWAHGATEPATARRWSTGCSLLGVNLTAAGPGAQPPPRERAAGCRGSSPRRASCRTGARSA